MKHSIKQEWLKVLKELCEVSKSIVDNEAIAVVISKNNQEMKLVQSDYVYDYIFLGLTKITKTLIAILELERIGCYEDALILTRSNLEMYFKSRAVYYDDKLVDNFIQIELGLHDKKYRIISYNKRLRTRIIKSINGQEFNYLDNYKEIALRADEVYLYSNFYGFLSEVCHCNMITSGYYRKTFNEEKYSYNEKSGEARFNLLMINIIIIIKEFKILLDTNLIKNVQLINDINRIIVEGKKIVLEGIKDEIYSISEHLLNIEKSKKVDNAQQAMKWKRYLKKIEETYQFIESI